MRLKRAAVTKRSRGGGGCQNCFHLPLSLYAETRLLVTPAQHINFGHSHFPQKIPPNRQKWGPQMNFPELSGPRVSVAILQKPRISRNFPISDFGVPIFSVFGEMKLICYAETRLLVGNRKLPQEIADLSRKLRTALTCRLASVLFSTALYLSKVGPIWRFFLLCLLAYGDTIPKP